MHNADPPLHLIVNNGPAGWATWCGGGPAMEENTPSQRRCRNCLALAREELAENPPADDESTDFDWFVGRVVTRTAPEVTA